MRRQTSQRSFLWTSQTKWTMGPKVEKCQPVPRFYALVDQGEQRRISHKYYGMPCWKDPLGVLELIVGSRMAVIICRFFGASEIGNILPPP